MALELEGDVVFGARAGRGRCRRTCRLKVARVDRDVAALLEAIAAAGALLAAAEELDGIGADLDEFALARAVLGLPLAPLEAPVDGDRPPLGEEARAVVALGAPDGDREVVRLVGPLAGRAVLAPGVHGHPQRAHAHARLKRAELGVTRQIAGKDDAVDVRRSHVLAPFSEVCERV